MALTLVRSKPKFIRQRWEENNMQRNHAHKQIFEDLNQSKSDSSLCRNSILHEVDFHHTNVFTNYDIEHQVCLHQSQFCYQVHLRRSSCFCQLVKAHHSFCNLCCCDVNDSLKFAFVKCRSLSCSARLHFSVRFIKQNTTSEQTFSYLLNVWVFGKTMIVLCVKFFYCFDVTQPNSWRAWDDDAVVDSCIFAKQVISKSNCWHLVGLITHH